MLRTLLLEPLFNALLFLYAIIPGGDFGVAVIVLTAIIRLAMWPLVKKQVHQQRVMKELKPEVDKLKKKAGGDKQKESQMMMELYKEKGVNPFASFGIILIQLPIFIALFFTLREIVGGDTLETTTYAFLQSLPAIQAIVANPASFDPTLFGLIDMSEPHIVLALTAGASQFIQAKQMSPKDEEKDEQTAKNTSQNQNSEKNGKKDQPTPPSMQKMMSNILPVVMVIVAMQLPSALAVYWTVGSIVAIGQQYIILNDISLKDKVFKRAEAS